MADDGKCKSDIIMSLYLTAPFLSQTYSVEGRPASPTAPLEVGRTVHPATHVLNHIIVPPIAHRLTRHHLGYRSLQQPTSFIAFLSFTSM
jgi:hypothetical protein